MESSHVAPRWCFHSHPQDEQLDDESMRRSPSDTHRTPSARDAQRNRRRSSDPAADFDAANNLSNLSREDRKLMNIMRSFQLMEERERRKSGKPPPARLDKRERSDDRDEPLLAKRRQGDPPPPPPPRLRIRLTRASRSLPPHGPPIPSVGKEKSAREFRAA
jgi:hypothetical protein